MDKCSVDAWQQPSLRSFSTGLDTLLLLFRAVLLLLLLQMLLCVLEGEEKANSFLFITPIAKCRCLLLLKLPVLPWLRFPKSAASAKEEIAASQVEIWAIFPRCIIFSSILAWLEGNIFHPEVIRLYTNMAPQSGCSDTSVTFCSTQLV